MFKHHHFEHGPLYYALSTNLVLPNRSDISAHVLQYSLMEQVNSDYILGLWPNKFTIKTSCNCKCNQSIFEPHFAYVLFIYERLRDRESHQT